MMAPPALEVASSAWPGIAAALPLPWPTEAVLADLRWWTATQGRLPGRRALATRWGWGERQTKAVLRDRSAWLARRGAAFALSPSPGRLVASDRGARPRPTHLHLSPDHLRELRSVARATPEYRRMVREGAEREEIEHEVIARVLARQDLPSAYDSARGSVGAYLQTLVPSLVRHLAEEHRAGKRRCVSTGAMTTTEDGARIEVDASLVAVASMEVRRPELVAIDALTDALTGPRRPSVVRVRRLAEAVIAGFEAAGRL